MSSESGEITWQRIESKYVVNAELAARLRDYCRKHMELDPYSARQPNHEYPIHSIYLDSPDGELLRSTLNAQPDRLKLRVRTYRYLNQPNGNLPSFFEVKRKSYGVVIKSRAMLPRQEADNALWRGTLSGELNSMGAGDGKHSAGINDFLSISAKIRAKPVISVFYTREAYVSDAMDNVRISFDQNLHYGLLDLSGPEPKEMWWPVRLQGIIFEIKFSNSFPFWVRKIISGSELARRGVCKFAMCCRSSAGDMVNEGASQLI